jgi:hypothetical protein
MNNTLRAVLVLTLMLATGCATTSSPPLKGEFGDIPVLEGLTYRPDSSTVIETYSVRAARLLYRGRMEPASVAVETQKALEGNGWRMTRNSSAARDGIVQLYEKGDASLQVRVWEGGWFNYYTYLEVSGTRPTQRSTATVSTR